MIVPFVLVLSGPEKAIVSFFCMSIILLSLMLVISSWSIMIHGIAIKNMLGLALGSFGGGDDFVIPISGISYLEMGVENSILLILDMLYLRLAFAFAVRI